MHRLLRVFFGRSQAKEVRPSRERPFCFLHIPKAAGASVREYLKDHLGADRVFTINGNPRNSIDELRNEDLYSFHRENKYVAYSAHIPSFWLRSFPQPPETYCILREPIDRVISHYYFLKQYIEHAQIADRHPLLTKIAHVEIGEFIREEPWRSQAFFGELQTRWLSIGPIWEIQDYCAASHRNRLGPYDRLEASRNLFQCVTVGLADRIDESLAILAARFGWPAPTTTYHENKTSRRPSRDELEPGVRRMLQSMTRYDRVLYRFATSIFRDELHRTHHSHRSVARLEIQSFLKLAY